MGSVAGSLDTSGSAVSTEAAGSLMNYRMPCRMFVCPGVVIIPRFTPHEHGLNSPMVEPSTSVFPYSVSSFFRLVIYPGKTSM